MFKESSMNEEISKIALITTGGTIDKDYFDALSEYQVVESIIPDLLARIGSTVEVERFEVCRKDSLEIQEPDRAALKELVSSLDHSKILVTHGTDTMVDTAKYLGVIEGKTIVFTGAMRPARFSDTDALFNVGVAIGALRSNDSGVFIAMSGKVFEPTQVVKNREAQRFENIGE
jgi:L-asparaginase